MSAASLGVASFDRIKSLTFDEAFRMQYKRGDWLTAKRDLYVGVGSDHGKLFYEWQPGRPKKIYAGERIQNGLLEIWGLVTNPEDFTDEPPVYELEYQTEDSSIEVVVVCYSDGTASIINYGEMGPDGREVRDPSEVNSIEIFRLRIR